MHALACYELMFELRYAKFSDKLKIHASACNKLTLELRYARIRYAHKY